MNLAHFAVNNRALVHFIEVLLVVAGVLAYQSLGKLEDPNYSIKRGVITTAYPGASPEEVELEVTDRIEKALQEMPQLDRLYSESRAGVSIIRVDINAIYWSDKLPQVWDVMRKKIRDIEEQFPPGVQKPSIGDDYGLVYGFVLAVTGDGFSHRELHDYAKFLKKELNLVPGVARIDLWGNRSRAIYIDVTESQVAELGLSSESFVQTLGDQNMVVDAGHVDVVDRRLRVAPTGEFLSPDEIGDLVLRPTLLETLASAGSTQEVSGTESGPRAETNRRQGSQYSGSGATNELIRIRDIGSVQRGYADPPRWMMRFNGEPSIALSIASATTGSVLDTGEALSARLAELRALLPVGVEIHEISWQSQFVEEGISSFMDALRDALIIVLVVVMIALGWRLGIVVGSGLVLAILGVFIFMAVMGIELHRISLGALIIALGMIVDDIIVVSDLYLVKLGKGVDKVQAAIDAAQENAKPLFWATTVAAFAFFPIFMSAEGAGEFCRALFLVVSASLVISWVFAMTLTPVRCIIFMPNPPKGAEQGEAPPGRIKRAFEEVLVFGIARRYPMLGLATAVLAVAVVGFGDVQKMFFPFAERTQILIDYWGAQGTRIEHTSEALERIEKKLAEFDYVSSVSAFIGQGSPRFYLPVDSQWTTKEYGQLLVNTDTPEGVDRLVRDLQPWAEEQFAEGMVRFRRMGVGPATTWKFELRFMGPAEAELDSLRAVGEEAMEILRASPLATDVRIDMRQREKQLVPEYDQERGRLANLSRPDVGRASKRLRDGLQVGLYREGDELYPILLRNVADERENAVARLPALQVRSSYATEPVPLGQVTDGFEPDWFDPIVTRYNRRRQVAVQASPVEGATFPDLHASVVQAIDAIKLPAGYQVLWDGQFRDSIRAQGSLVPGMVPAAIIMLTILIYLFNAYRPVAVILLTIPFAMIGITAGLLVFEKSFGFVAILGVLSLTGIMIRNSVVLLETIDHQVEAGETRYRAVIDAALSRGRPVLVCAVATGLGLVPLFPDVFWGSLAAALLFGVLVGTLLTLVLAPVLYATLYGLHAPKAGEADGEPRPTR